MVDSLKTTKLELTQDELAVLQELADEKLVSNSKKLARIARDIILALNEKCEIVKAKELCKIQSQLSMGVARNFVYSIRCEREEGHTSTCKGMLKGEPLYFGAGVVRMPDIEVRW